MSKKVILIFFFKTHRLSVSLISFGLRKNALYVFVQQKAKALCSQSQAYTWATLYLLTKPKSLKSSLSFLLGHSFMGLEGF